jgi:hypothetical protein
VCVDRVGVGCGSRERPLASLDRESDRTNFVPPSRFIVIEKPDEAAIVRSLADSVRTPLTLVTRPHPPQTYHRESTGMMHFTTCL